MKFKSEKGSITVYVLVAIFFLLAIIAGRFVIANRNLKVQYDSLVKIKNFYEKNDKIYVDNGEDGDGTGDDGDTPGVVERPSIYIFNKDALEFFWKDNGTNRFYVYQTGIYYIKNESARKSGFDVLIQDNEKYVLMSDITLPYSYNKYSVAQDEFIKNLDFNNHLIFIEKAHYQWPSGWVKDEEEEEDYVFRKDDSLPDYNGW